MFWTWRLGLQWKGGSKQKVFLRLFLEMYFPVATALQKEGIFEGLEVGVSTDIQLT